jgi:hypothetical protein
LRLTSCAPVLHSHEQRHGFFLRRFPFHKHVDCTARPGTLVHARGNSPDSGSIASVRLSTSTSPSWWSVNGHTTVLTMSSDKSPHSSPGPAYSPHDRGLPPRILLTWHSRVTSLAPPSIPRGTTAGSRRQVSEDVYKIPTSGRKSPSSLPLDVCQVSQLLSFTMFPRASLLALAFAAVVSAQQVGTNTAETHPKITASTVRIVDADVKLPV